MREMGCRLIMQRQYATLANHWLAAKTFPRPLGPIYCDSILMGEDPFPGT
jgi:hypothetical protein